MKVLAIVASARKTGNSEILAKEMLASLPDSVEKRMICLAELNIEPCRACYACLPTGSDCVIQDDFSSFLRQLRAADAVILSSPVYFLGMHTRLKLICDRLISVLNEADKYAGRRCVVTVPYGVAGWQGYGVEATVSFARFLHLDVVGVLPVHAANPGEAVRSEVLNAARGMAERLIVGEEENFAADVSQGLESGDITCAFCGSGLVRLRKNGEVRCAICDARGLVDFGREEAGPSCRWEEPAHFRYSGAGMKEHAERLESIKRDFISRRHELADCRAPYRKLQW